MDKYSVIIFDLDGTAIPNIPNGLPSPKLIDTIAQSKSKIRLCAATGRPITNAKPILDALDLDAPCIISAGTQIINPKTGDILWETAIAEREVAQLLDICKPYPYELLFHTEVMGEGAAAANRRADGSINAIYIMGCSIEDASAITAQLGSIAAITAAGVTSWSAESIDIHVTPSNATKEHAVAKLLDLLNIEKEAAVGVGDADNDIHLFQAVGYKVAMGNATDRLKAQADEICESVDNDGLAALIQKLTA